MDKQYSYIYFPLCLLTKVHVSGLPKDAMSDILDYGIVQYSKQFNYLSEYISFDLFEVYRQIMYVFYKDEDKLAFEIKEWIYELIEDDSLCPNYDYKGFSDNEFIVDEETDAMHNAWDSELEKQEVCIRFYQMRQAMKSLSLTGNLDAIWRNYLKVSDELKLFEKLNGSDALVSIKTDLIMDFYKNDKIDYEYELFTAFCAIKSIIGSKKYASTNKLFIVKRMLGAKNNKVFESILNDKKTGRKLKVVFDKYTKRYHIDKLISTLLNRKFLSSKIAMKGERNIYLSSSLTYEELAIELGKKPNIKSKNEANKQKEKDAILLLKDMWRKR